MGGSTWAAGGRWVCPAHPFTAEGAASSPPPLPARSSLLGMVATYFRTSCTHPQPRFVTAMGPEDSCSESSQHPR